MELNVHPTESIEATEAAGCPCACHTTPEVRHILPCCGVCTHCGSYFEAGTEHLCAMVPGSRSAGRGATAEVAPVESDWNRLARVTLHMTGWPIAAGLGSSYLAELSRLVVGFPEYTGLHSSVFSIFMLSLLAGMIWVPLVGLWWLVHRHGAEVHRQDVWLLVANTCGVALPFLITLVDSWTSKRGAP